MRIFYLIFLIPVFLGCAQSKYKDPEYVAYADQISTKICNELWQKEKLYLNGFGGSFLYNVEKIALHFRAERHADVSQARRLFVNAAERLLSEINQGEQIRPYLDHYPFTNRGLSFSINFVNADNKRVTDGSVAYVFVVKGTIYYDKYDAGSKQLLDLYEEPYEEALRIVRAEEVAQRETSDRLGD